MLRDGFGARGGKHCSEVDTRTLCGSVGGSG